MKRDKFFDIAEKMYVEQFITEEEIAKRIGVCDRTIRRWKALGDWGIKRDGFLKANTISKDAMYSLAHKMLDYFDEDMNNNKHIDSSRMYMFTNLMDEVLKKKKQSYTKEEFLRIIRQVVDMEKEKKKFYHWETDKYLDEPEEELYLYETDRIIAEQQKKRGCG